LNSDREEIPKLGSLAPLSKNLFVIHRRKKPLVALSQEKASFKQKQKQKEIAFIEPVKFCRVSKVTGSVLSAISEKDFDRMHSVEPVTYGMDESRSLIRDLKYIVKQLFTEHLTKQDGPYNLDLIINRVILYRMGHENGRGKQDIW